MNLREEVSSPHWWDQGVNVKVTVSELWVTLWEVLLLPCLEYEYEFLSLFFLQVHLIYDDYVKGKKLSQICSLSIKESDSKVVT